MALALVHHLAISNNLPLELLSEFFAGITRWLIIEFVPKADPQVELLLAAREDIFDEYTESRFEAVFHEHFEILAEQKIEDSPRTLYLMEKRPAQS